MGCSMNENHQSTLNMILKWLTEHSNKKLSTPGHRLSQRYAIDQQSFYSSSLSNIFLILFSPFI